MSDEADCTVQCVFQFDDNARNDERVTSSPPTDELLCRGRDRTQEGASEGGREANQRNSGGGDGERKAAGGGKEGGREGAISRSPGTISGKVPRRRHNFSRIRRRSALRFYPRGKFCPLEGFFSWVVWYLSFICFHLPRTVMAYIIEH